MTYENRKAVYILKRVLNTLIRCGKYILDYMGVI